MKEEGAFVARNRSKKQQATRKPHRNVSSIQKSSISLSFYLLLLICMSTCHAFAPNQSRGASLPKLPERADIERKVNVVNHLRFHNCQSQTCKYHAAKTVVSMTLDPYEQQYQQYVQSLKNKANVITSGLQDSSSAACSPTPTSVAEYSTPQQPPQQVMVEEQEEEDRGDEFLRMLSSEVTYKKFLFTS